MNVSIKEKLEKRGWKVSETKEFLGLSAEEMQLVELRISLGGLLREKREAVGSTQTVFAKEIGTSQSRLAKMEAGDSSVSIDLLLKSLFHLIPSKEVYSYIAQK